MIKIILTAISYFGGVFGGSACVDGVGRSSLVIMPLDSGCCFDVDGICWSSFAGCFDADGVDLSDSISCKAW